MAKIAWRGGTANHLTVGPTGDHSTLQSALDAVASAGDAAPGNRYAITCQSFVEQVTAAVVDNNPHTDVVAEAAGGYVLEHAGTAGGGTLRIGSQELPSWTGVVEDKLYHGMRIVRSGFSTSKAANPEGAVFVGAEETYPSSPNWNDIWIIACQIDGSHDALQAFGTSPLGYPAGPVPKMFFYGNQIRCQHDSVALKGDARFMSESNVIRVDPIGTGVSTYLTEPSPGWKQTGFHFNSWRPSSSGDITARNPDAVFISNGDTVIIDGRTQHVGDLVGQGVVAGFYFYDVHTTADATRHLPAFITAPSIRVRLDDDGSGSTPVDLCGGVVVSGRNQEIAAGDLVISGGTIDVESLSDTTNSPDNVDGVVVDCSHADTPGTLSTAQIGGTFIRCANAKTAGSASSLRTTLADSRVEFAAVYSASAADDSAGGDITALAAVAVP